MGTRRVPACLHRSSFLAHDRRRVELSQAPDRTYGVTPGGLVRRTSGGALQRIEIEIFRWVIERLLRGDTVLRDEINAQYAGRASSGIVLVLASLPMFESVKVGGKRGLRLHGEARPDLP
jgi:hypothetical protein